MELWVRVNGRGRDNLSDRSFRLQQVSFEATFDLRKQNVCFVFCLWFSACKTAQNILLARVTLPDDVIQTGGVWLSSGVV